MSFESIRPLVESGALGVILLFILLTLRQIGWFLAKRIVSFIDGAATQQTEAMNKIVTSLEQHEARQSARDEREATLADERHKEIRRLLRKDDDE